MHSLSFLLNAAAVKPPSATLARARHFQFSDTDHRLQVHEQRTVAEIVQAEGWAFRELETLSLKAVTLPNTVIATGGGIVLAEGNRQFMRENGVVIYPQAPVSALIDRLKPTRKPNSGRR